MISPFAPIHLPTLNKDQIKIEVGEDFSDSRNNSAVHRVEDSTVNKTAKRLDQDSNGDNPELYQPNKNIDPKK